MIPEISNGIITHPIFPLQPETFFTNTGQPIPRTLINRPIFDQSDGYVIDRYYGNSIRIDEPTFTFGALDFPRKNQLVRIEYEQEPITRRKFYKIHYYDIIENENFYLPQDERQTNIKDFIFLEDIYKLLPVLRNTENWLSIQQYQNLLSRQLLKSGESCSENIVKISGTIANFILNTKRHFQKK